MKLINYMGRFCIKHSDGQNFMSANSWADGFLRETELLGQIILGIIVFKGERDPLNPRGLTTCFGSSYWLSMLMSPPGIYTCARFAFIQSFSCHQHHVMYVRDPDQGLSGSLLNIPPWQVIRRGKNATVKSVGGR